MLDAVLVLGMPNVVGFSHDADGEKILNKVQNESIEVKRWNVKNFGGRLAVDAVSAATAAGMVAPVITIIDKAVVERVAGHTTLSNSIRVSLKSLLFRPQTLLLSRPFAIMLLLYGSTYLTANTIDTLTSTTSATPASRTSSTLSKFLAVSSVNMSLALYKDSNFARIFGSAAVSARPLPPLSYLLFAVRDSLTIFASFNLPQVIAPMLPLSPEAERYISRASAAQLGAPAAVQVLGTPLHLLGLDLLNRNGRLSARERLRKVWVDWPTTTAARMCRVVPAFGVGGVVNAKMRARLMRELE